MRLIRKAIRRLRRVARTLVGPSVPDGSTGDQRSPKRKKDRYRRDSSANTYDALDLLRSTTVSQIHASVVERIRERLAADPQDDLRIAFVVSSPSRWNSDTILRAVAEHPRMSAEVIVRRPEYQASDDEVARLYEEAVSFFSHLDVPVHQGYDLARRESVPIEDFDHDVYFFEMPWGMRDFPRRVTGKALPVYLHYGFMMMANHGMHYNVASFHAYLWRYFTQTESHRRLHLEHDPNADARIEVTGYPKLDVYEEDADGPADAVDLTDTRTNASTSLSAPIIYAPHHSLGKQYLSMSTFDWSGHAMRGLAEEHSSIDWVYKPHPSLWFNVARAGYMTKEEYARYEQGWSELPNAAVYDSGRYFDLFKRSSALITCSGSFLAEYLPTGRPILWLRSSTTVGLNRIGERLAEGFYIVHDEAELRETFDRVIVRGDDYLSDTRAALTGELFPKGRSAGRNIVEHLAEQLVP